MKLSLPISVLALAIACYALFVAEGERRIHAEQRKASENFFKFEPLDDQHQRGFSIR